MEGRRSGGFGLAICVMAMAACLVGAADKEIKVKSAKGEKVCDQGWECKGYSKYCCNLTISDIFQTYQFENLFSKRNTPVANAVGFWDYRSFILAASTFEHLGFGTTGGKLMQMKEIAAFLGHVGCKTSCGYGVATGGPLAWGLCFNKEMSPSQKYCDEFYKYEYPCAPGAEYYGRGAIPIYWNYNYGAIGKGINQDLLNHPEYVEQNATIAFQAAIYRWMMPVKRTQPSAHDVFVGNWKPTKNDTLAKRVPGFGSTMNILYSELTCGQGDIDPMNNIISHYLYYLDLLGIGREEAGPHEVLSCADQLPFNPSTTKSSS
ncbi:serine/threonine protein kinase, CMGC, dual-specificity [Salvia divinorum]|uniref:Serine/threonine protein kinase, CMGC, dual-specificity n=1 Tax=Salvia divinorum TaxID=28513 RepID=A0ABD1GP87_SALDI